MNNTLKENPQPSIELMRAGITNFIGQSISLMPFEGKKRNKLIVAMLMEEVLKVSKIDNDKPCDLEILTSLFKSVRIVLKQNITYMNKNPDKESKQRIVDFMDIIDILDSNKL